MTRPIKSANLASAIQKLENEGAIDLSARAERGELSRAYGRDKEVEQLFEAILDRRSAILIGPTDVGKTAVLHEAVNRIAERRAPALLQFTRVVQLSTQTILAGSRNSGEWSGKLRDIIAAVTEGQSIVLYFENIANLRQAGTYSGHSTSLATSLRPYLERRDLVLLGEMTEEAFAESPSMSSASGGGLTSRAPSLADDPALMRVFTLLPLEEPDLAATQAILTAVAGPLAQRYHRQIEPAALERVLALTRRFLPYRAFPGKAVHLLQELLRRVDRQPDAAQPARPPAEEEEATVSPAMVTEEFSRQTGLPHTIISDEVPLLASDVRAFFLERVVGQGEAVEAVVDQVMMVKAELQDPGRPLGVFLFLGPTGSGKTYLAKTLAEYLFGSVDKLVRFDMSEFQRYDSAVELAARMVDKLRRASFSVLLFDEVEKAHPLVFDLFLQAFDDARLTDQQGRTLNLRNAIIILTSNLGSRIGPHEPLGFASGASRRPDLRAHFVKAVEEHFRPELVNRLDRIVAFNSLTREDMWRIARRELGRALLREGLGRRNVVIQPVRDEVIDVVVRTGFTEQYGARPLQRAIKDLVLRPLAHQIAARPSAGDQLLELRAEDDRLVVALVPLESSPSRPPAATPARFPSTRTPLRETAQAVQGVRQRLGEHLASERFRALVEHKHRLVEATQAASFWDDPSRSRRVLIAIHHLERITDRVSGLHERVERLADQVAALERARPPDSARQIRLEGAYLKLERESVLPELELLASVPETVGSAAAVLIVSPIARPHQADAEWPRQLRDMYAGWAERHGYEVEVVSEPGAAEIMILISGGSVGGMLRGESGVHRREPSAEERGSGGRRPKRGESHQALVHQALVEVLPLASLSDEPSADVQVRRIGELPAESGSASRPLVEATAGGARVRLVGEQAARIAPALLTARAEKHEDEPRLALARVYRFDPAPSVHDPRSGEHSARLKDVLGGDLDAFLVAFLRGTRAPEPSVPERDDDPPRTPDAPLQRAPLGERIEVSSDGHSGPTLAQALAGAPDHAIIQVPAGSHHLAHGVTLRRSVSLVGAGMDETEIVGSGGEHVLRLDGGGRLGLRDLALRFAGGGVGDVVGVRDAEIEIERCRFSGGTSSGVGAGAGLELRGTIQGGVRGCEFVRNGYGITLDGPAAPTLEQNAMSENRLAAIAYFGASGGVARDNTCLRNGEGILVGEKAQPLLERNACREGKVGINFVEQARGEALANECRDNSGDGIRIAGTAQPTVRQNQCVNNLQHGIYYLDESAGSAAENACRDNRIHGIFLAGRARPTLEDNVCTANGKDGISIRETASPRVDRNTCESNGEDGIYVASGTAAVLGTNTCRNNKERDLRDNR